MRARAARVIPGGWHLSGNPLVDSETTPSYFERAQGCRIWDVDGNEYIDYLMAFGAVLVGYAEPRIERAATDQAKRGRLLSLNHPLHVEFIEALLRRFPGMEMGAFFKTGSEATTAALRIARRHTGRRVVARAGYHGWHDWCLPLADCVPAGLERQVLEFRAVDPGTLQALFVDRPGEIAAVIVAPEMIVPHDPAVFRELARITRANRALFVMDEVKTALRILPGSVYERVGVVPDLVTISKALGNGFAVAAVLGRRTVMESAAGMHYSATFHGETPAMAAALTCMSIVEEERVREHVWTLGQQLIDGLNALASDAGVPAQAYGEPLPPMPFFRFVHPNPEVNARLTARFFREMLARGVLLHPRHLWFVSLAHTSEDIAVTLARACEALAAARAEL